MLETVLCTLSATRGRQMLLTAGVKITVDAGSSVVWDVWTSVHDCIQRFVSQNVPLYTFFNFYWGICPLSDAIPFHLSQIDAAWHLIGNCCDSKLPDCTIQSIERWHKNGHVLLCCTLQSHMNITICFVVVTLAFGGHGSCFCGNQ